MKISSRDNQLRITEITKQVQINWDSINSGKLTEKDVFDLRGRICELKKELASRLGISAVDSAGQPLVYAHTKTSVI